MRQKHKTYKHHANPRMSKELSELRRSGAAGYHKQYDDEFDTLSEVQEELEELGIYNVKVSL